MPTNITAFDGLIVPQRNDRTNFASRGDLWMAAFQNFQTQANMQAGELNTLANQVDADAAAAAAVASVISGALIDANTLATSTTSLSIPSTVPAARSFVLAQTGKLFSVGHPVVLVSAANPYNWMVGTLTAFAGESGAGTVNVMYAHGAGTYADWTVALCPLPMTTTNNAVVAKSATFQAKKADTGQVIEASGTWSLTYEACATLMNGWYHYIKTASSGTITLDPNGSETVNGASTLALSSDAFYLVYCDGSALKAINLVGVGDHEVTVHTGNGHGSTNTCIRRFTTTVRNVGTAITYADSAANGASFTINESGDYEIAYTDSYDTAAAGWVGATVNSVQLTTAFSSTTASTRIGGAYAKTDGGMGTLSTASITRTVKLAAGDVVRCHTDGAISSTNNFTQFSIRKVG